MNSFVLNSLLTTSLLPEQPFREIETDVKDFEMNSFVLNSLFITSLSSKLMSKGVETDAKDFGIHSQLHFYPQTECLLLAFDIQIANITLLDYVLNISILICSF